MTGRVTNITRTSFHDGPGMRTVVYLKGCPMSCLWCHNPESIRRDKQVAFYPARCIGCGRCLQICPEHHFLQNHEHIFNREGCRYCFRCCDRCPADALQPIGQDRSAEDVFTEIQRDHAYYRSTGGGVTLSGGECLLYPDFAARLLAMCRNDGISTAIETALYVPRSSVEKVLPYVDTFIADIKHADSLRHRHLTGVDNQRILDNIRYTAAHHSNVWIRIPLIPGCNDEDENLRATAELINGFAGGIRRVELLRFNNLAESKYETIERPYTLPAMEPQTAEVMERKVAVMRSACRLQVEFCYS